MCKRANEQSQKLSPLYTKGLNLLSVPDLPKLLTGLCVCGHIAEGGFSFDIIPVKATLFHVLYIYPKYSDTLTPDYTRLKI